MTKVIVLSTVLGLSALGMACGGAENTNVTVKPANVATPAPATPASTMAPATNVAPANAANTGNANAMRPPMNANASNANKTTMAPANAMNKPANK